MILFPTHYKQGKRAMNRGRTLLFKQALTSAIICICHKCVNLGLALSQKIIILKARIGEALVLAKLISYLFVKIVKIYSSFLQGAHEMEEVHFLQSWEQWVSDHQPFVEPPVRLNHHHQLEVWKSLPLESKCIRSLWTLSLSSHPKISSFDYTFLW